MSLTSPFQGGSGGGWEVADLYQNLSKNLLAFLHPKYMLSTKASGLGTNLHVADIGSIDDSDLNTKTTKTS
jgi:hypothetical protein